MNNRPDTVYVIIALDGEDAWIKGSKFYYDRQSCVDVLHTLEARYIPTTNPGRVDMWADKEEYRFYTIQELSVCE